MVSGQFYSFDILCKIRSVWIEKKSLVSVKLCAFYICIKFCAIEIYHNESCHIKNWICRGLVCIVEWCSGKYVDVHLYGSYSALYAVWTNKLWVCAY